MRQDNSDINQFLFHMFVLLLFSPQDKWFKQELLLLVSGCADSDWEVMPLSATLQLVNGGIVLINHRREQRKGSFRPSSPSSSFMYPKQIVLLGDDITREKISSSEDTHLKLYHHLYVWLSTMLILPLADVVLALRQTFKSHKYMTVMCVLV